MTRSTPIYSQYDALDTRITLKPVNGGQIHRIGGKKHESCTSFDGVLYINHLSLNLDMTV